MSLKNDDHANWIQNGRQRAAVARALRKPMTGSELCRAACKEAPCLQLRDLWLILKEMKRRKLVVCLNPRHVTGKLHVLTNRGRTVVRQAFGLSVPPLSTDVDWRAYAQVARSKSKRELLLRLSAVSPAEGTTATHLRKSLLEPYPMGLSAVVRALKDLERLGLVRVRPEGRKGRQKGHELTEAGLKVVRQWEA